MTVVEATAPRMLPALTDANRAYLTGGRDGNLMVGRCRACRRWALPPATACPSCGSELHPEAASGRAEVLTWTLNSHRYHPEIPPPYIIAIVVLDEQDDLRVATNLIDCTEADVHAGMAVTVVFEDRGEIFYPLFRPAVPAEDGR